MTPRIAIPQPTSADFAYNQRSWPSYASAIHLSGGEAVLLELGLSRVEAGALAASCDGILLPGSPADVDPVRYGRERDPTTAAADPAREALDFLLLDHAAERGKPVLGVCFGLQSMNVWRGGSLVQDLAPMPVNHEAGGKVAVAHAVVVAQESVLGEIVDGDEAPMAGGLLRLPVNTSHHQAVGVPGEGLRIVARCPEDGVIEALELDPTQELFHVEQFPDGAPFMLGVQWHPERSFEISAASRALFGRLVGEARRFAHARPGGE